ncbi:serine hydrolase [Wenzhouxiangella sp. AB-CW3]|uniref:serine hydrolase n=1 Tax=Wenzhouxiangella sp. AB-CW3 TaxID=2771012 RepID=UPI00168AFE70|nr:serine hydrolase [Wenzhouxiangella sp. AB-CW3]QOC22637.1 serine hydrolase [Wenzhouxiangella sp. AB-CW3]
MYPGIQLKAIGPGLVRCTRRGGLLLLLLAGCVSPLWAEEPALDEHPQVVETLALLETWIDAQRAYEGVPGVSMAVVHDDQVLWRKAFGQANPDADVPARTDTLYSICSISKLFTAVAAMQLRDRGKLALHDPVRDVLPWFDMAGAGDDSRPVTLWGLLTHAAGLPRESDFPYWTPPDFPFPPRELIRQRLAEQEMLYPPERTFQYSNLGLTLAGELVAEASESSFDDYVRQNLLEPLNMRDTRTYMPDDLHGERLAVGHGARNRAGERVAVPLFDARGIAPAAGFSSTADDLARFAIWQLGLLGGNGDTDLLAADTLREMQRVQWLEPDWQTARGLGFGVYRPEETIYVGHSGSCPGYRSALWLQTDDAMAATALANASGVDTELWVRRALEAVSTAVNQARNGQAVALPTEFSDYLGSYSLAPWGGEVAVVGWRGNLAMLELPTSDPVGSLVMLEHVEDDRFRWQRRDDLPGDLIEFERDEQGRVVAYHRHSNRWPRIEE